MNRIATTLLLAGMAWSLFASLRKDRALAD